MRDLPLQWVVMRDSTLSEMPTGTIRRKRAEAAIESSRHTPATAPAYMVYHLTVEGENLRAVNRLYDDIRGGSAVPAQFYIL
jgi:hypothetical protein